MFHISAQGQTGIGDGADRVRALAWFGFLLFLDRDARFAPAAHVRWFAAAAVTVALLGAVGVALEPGELTPGLARSMLVFARLGLAVVELLLIENLYLNLPEHSRWHVALPAVLLGALACFDVVLTADAALFGWGTQALTGARTVGMILVGPLLAVAATRGQRWHGPVRTLRAADARTASPIKRIISAIPAC